MKIQGAEAFRGNFDNKDYAVLCVHEKCYYTTACMNTRQARRLIDQIRLVIKEIEGLSHE